MRPEVLASRIVKRVDDTHAFLINRNKSGSMILPGESLFVLEMQPAAYAILAANEAEKAADVKVVDYRMMGATGRVYLSGEEADIRAAARRGRAGARGEAVMAERIDKEELRQLVREVLKEALSAVLTLADREGTSNMVREHRPGPASAPQVAAPRARG